MHLKNGVKFNAVSIASGLEDKNQTFCQETVAITDKQGATHLVNDGRVCSSGHLEGI